MFGQLDIFRIAQGLATHASARQAKIAANIANADTPGYRAQDIQPFAETYRADHGAHGALKATRARHIHESDGAGIFAPAQAIDRPGEAAPDGNTVSLELEMVEAAKVRQTHDLALTVYKSALNILRSSIRPSR